MNASAPFFSIIIAVCNREDFISNTIDSVLDQQYGDFELIVVNDGSTDGTEAKIKEFSDPRIRYLKITNSERAMARNTGAAVARGRYFNFFDSDDLMYPHHLGTAAAFAEDHEAPAWFHVGYDICDRQGNIIIRETGTDDPEKRLIKTNYLGCDSVFVRRDVFQENQFDPDRRMASSEDWELWLRMISREKLLRCAEVTFRMIHHDGRSLMVIPAWRVIERDSFMLTQLLGDSAFVTRFKDNLRLFEADRYTFFALCLILESEGAKGIGYLMKALKTTPEVLTRKRFWACIKLVLTGIRK